VPEVLGPWDVIQTPSRRWSPPSIEGHERMFALMGAFTIAFSSILVRLSHASPSTAAIFRCVYALPILGLLAWREDRRHGSRGWRERRAGLASGVFFGIDMLLWNHSIVDVGAGLATVLANIQVVILPLVAWALLSEPPGKQILLALPVALIGVLLISGVLEHGAYGRDPTRGTVFGLAAGVAYVGFLLLLRHGGADLRRPAGPLCDATLVAAVVCVVAGVVIGDARLVPSWPSAGWLAILALSSQVIGWLLISASLPRLPAAVSSVLLTLQPIGSVALAALIFGESPTALQLTGVALVLVALVGAGRSRGGVVVGGGEGRGDDVWSGDGADEVGRARAGLLVATEAADDIGEPACIAGIGEPVVGDELGQRADPRRGDR
jgi:drug/metabolite transporter (DMT)-like permease